MSEKTDPKSDLRSDSKSDTKSEKRSARVAEKKTYDFLIAGVPYKLKTSHDDATVQELVDFVNGKMNQAMSVTKYGSFQNAAVLTALNVAEELILLKRKAHRELEKIEEKALKLSMDLENSKINRTV